MTERKLSRLEKFKSLLPKFNKKPLAETAKRLSRKEQKELNTKLFMAAINNNTEDIKRLLKKGADIDARDDEGTLEGATALIFAAKFRSMEACKLLIEEGSKIEATDIDGMTALMMAAREGNAEICKLLVEKGAKINAKDNETELTALIWAAVYGRTEICKLLLDNGAKIWMKDVDDYTALMHAKRKKHLGTAAFLTFETYAPDIFKEKAAKESFYSKFSECVKQ